MYSTGDPRRSLTTEVTPDLDPPGAAESVVFSDVEPTLEASGSHSWYVRAQNFITNYAQLQSGAVLSRQDQPDEYLVLISRPGMGVALRTADGVTEVWGPSLIIVPPGISTLTALTDGPVVRMLTTRATDLLSLCRNAASYDSPKPNVADLSPWPPPTDGYRLRTYSLDVADEPGRFGRIWRCTTFMINVLPAGNGPRDPSRLSPHTHDDFEQASIGLEGNFTHHLRWPWSSDRRTWREDEHLECSSPSVTVVPPPVLHTTEATSSGPNQLVDVFCPPRHDFSAKPGWVLNEDEYPVPASVTD